jgi:hypothetical protein
MINEGRLNPTIHPTMATSHDEVAGNRVAAHMAIPDASAEEKLIAQAASGLTGKNPGHNKKAIA